MGSVINEKRAGRHGVIAILLPCLLTGGTEVATLESAVALGSLGYAVHVVVYFDETDVYISEAFKAAGIVVHLLGVQRGGGARSYPALAAGLVRALRRGRYDAIWVQYMTPTLLPLALARLFTPNLVAAVHVASSHYSPSGLSRIRWLAHYWCNRFVCVSHTVAKGIFGEPESDLRQTGRVVVVPNALNMGIMQAAAVMDWRAQTDWPRDAVVIGFAGRLTNIKGVDVLLAAAADLHARGLPIRLVIVGDGSERDGLESRALELGICHITHFAGRMPRDTIFSAIKGFDIAAVPSRLEGFGLSALEAMAAGVPVVASRVDALQEVVQDGITGLLFPVDDPAKLADACARLVGDAVLRKSMGAAGVEHVLRLYDAPAYRAKLADLLTDMGLPKIYNSNIK